jgi:hypothetical protein
VCLSELLSAPFVTLRVSPFIAEGGTYKGAEPRHTGPGT